MSAPTTLAGWIALGPSMGLNPLNNVPPSMYAQALASLQRNIKSASNPPPPAQIAQGEAMLITRGLLYYKNNPGDCGSPTSLNLENVQIAQGAGELAGGIASVAGAALPGIGVAVQAITAIFQHHDQAVATEQETICAVSGVINQVIPYYDNQVRTGQISPATAKQGIQNFIAQVNGQLQSIYKQCNASCVYMSFLAAHADFLNYYYPAIAPVGLAPHAPGGAPATTANTPGGVVYSGTQVSSPIGDVEAAIQNPANGGYLILGIAFVIGIIIIALVAK